MTESDEITFVSTLSALVVADSFSGSFEATGESSGATLLSVTAVVGIDSGVLWDVVAAGALLGCGSVAPPCGAPVDASGAGDELVSATGAPLLA